VSYGKMTVGATAHAAAVDKTALSAREYRFFFPSLSFPGHLLPFPLQSIAHHILLVLHENYHILSQAIALVGSASIAL
jgi:hypothetical protein